MTIFQKWRDEIQLAKPNIGRAERRAVDQVLKSRKLAQGEKVNAFEQAFSGSVMGATCVAVNSGTSALHLSLLAAGIGPGDEVIVPSFTFAATGNAVALTGATPVWADIEPNHFCLDPNSAESVITSRTKAIMPVHLYGHPADMPAFVSLSKKYSLMLFEDAAQAHLASISNRPVGSWGVAGSFSFYPTKNMTTGEGGMVSSKDETMIRNIKLLRNQGMERRYENEVVGFNNRMTDISAAIGLVQLEKLPEMTRKRQSNAAFLSENLENVVVPSVAPNAVHVYHQFTIRVPGLARQGFAAELRRLGVPSDVYYPTPVHKLPTYRSHEKLPETQLATEECLSIPVHPLLKRWQLSKIVEAVNTTARAGA